MAKSVNKVILVGNLGTDPEVTYTPPGTAVAKITLATNDSFKDKDGQWQERTEWHNVVLWARLAERSPVAPVPRALAVRRLHPGHYAERYRADRAAFEPVFDRLLARATTRRMQRLVHRRRARWLVTFANERRGEGAYREAWSTLAAALPAGLFSPAWWNAASRTLVHPLLPRRLLSAWRRGRAGERT